MTSRPAPGTALTLLWVSRLRRLRGRGDSPRQLERLRATHSIEHEVSRTYFGYAQTRREFVTRAHDARAPAVELHDGASLTGA